MLDREFERAPLALQVTQAVEHDAGGVVGVRQRHVVARRPGDRDRLQAEGVGALNLLRLEVGVGERVAGLGTAPRVAGAVGQRERLVVQAHRGFELAGLVGNVALREHVAEALARGAVGRQRGHRLTHQRFRTLQVAAACHDARTHQQRCCRSLSGRTAAPPGFELCSSAFGPSGCEAWASIRPCTVNLKTAAIRSR